MLPRELRSRCQRRASILGTGLCRAGPLSDQGGALRGSGGLPQPVHFPTLSLSPTRSFKFGQKIFYVNYLSELSEHVKLEQLGIPRQVLK